VPIKSKDKSEDELAELVRAAIIEGIPKHQQPLD